MYVVYQLVNSKGKIEYVGHTSNIKRRMINHFDKTGKFHNRKDISYEIVKSGFRKKERAIDYECKLQKELGFETDRQKFSRNMKEVQKKTTEQKRIPIAQYDLNGNFIKKYPSILAAEKELKLRTIWNVVKGHQKSTKNFVFKSLKIQ
jgi:predicted GIY-YIG superfamily endonuclease